MLNMQGWLAIAICLTAVESRAVEIPKVEVSNVRRVFHNGEHNAFTDLIRFGERFYLTFRSCPDGHMVHPTASIILLASDDLQDWEQVHQFQVPLRDTRDPHFLVFQQKLFVYTGTWYCGETSPDRGSYDLNQHLGYAVTTEDGVHWSNPIMLEGTFGHYIWRASASGDTAFLCGRRKHKFSMLPKGEGAEVESAMLESSDGLVWKTRSLFQEQQGDETAFQFEADGRVLAVGRRGSGNAQLLTAPPPYIAWERSDLDQYIGGPLLIRWGERWVVGGRKNTANGPKTALHWLVEGRLHPFAELPSAGDNSYPGLVVLSPTHAVMSWYSSHERDAAGQPITAIYMADLRLLEEVADGQDVHGTLRDKISFTSSHDGSIQAAYFSIPEGLQPLVDASSPQSLQPLVVSLHSWSADLEQRQLELEQCAADRKWFCLQPNFRGINQTPEACGSEAAQQDILDAVDWALKNYPIDPNRVYLTGTSGGGHMTMMMAAQHPQKWAAASAWVGISDMAAWHATHRDDKYGSMLRACCGGAPGDSAQVNAEYRARSPLNYLHKATQVPLDLAAGIHDGHSGSVPVQHSLRAFNAIAAALGTPAVSEEDIRQISVDGARLDEPKEGDTGFDSAMNRPYYLRRWAGQSRVTIFEGGHEGIAAATIAWFDAHPTRKAKQ